MSSRTLARPAAPVTLVTSAALAMATATLATSSGYLDLRANWAFTDSWTLNAHAGRERIESNAAIGHANWRLGVMRTFGNGVAIAGAYTGTDADDALYRNAHGNAVADDALTPTVSMAF